MLVEHEYIDGLSPAYSRASTGHPTLRPARKNMNLYLGDTWLKTRPGYPTSRFSSLQMNPGILMGYNFFLTRTYSVCHYMLLVSCDTITYVDRNNVTGWKSRMFCYRLSTSFCPFLTSVLSVLRQVLFGEI